MADRETIIRRVRALRTQADKTSYEAESTEYRRKADELARKHGITDDELVEPEEGLLGGLFGFVGRMNKWGADENFPAWVVEQEKIRDRRNELHGVVRDAVLELISMAGTKDDAQDRMTDLEQLRKWMKGYIEDRIWVQDPETLKSTFHDGVVMARDKAIAEVFDQNCAYVVRRADVFRYDHMTDEEWKDSVKEHAEQMTSTFNIPVRSVQAALRRVNGYKRFNTVYFPKKKEQASMSLSNANDVPGTDGRWYYGVIVRADDHARISVYEKSGERQLEWRMEGKPLRGTDIDPEALRRITELEQV